MQDKIPNKGLLPAGKRDIMATGNEVSYVYEDLTKRQREIMDFITEETERRGYPPSVREIGKAVGLRSSSTVHGHLTRLEEKGYLRRRSEERRVGKGGGGGRGEGRECEGW